MVLLVKINRVFASPSVSEAGAVLALPSTRPAGEGAGSPGEPGFGEYMGSDGEDGPMDDPGLPPQSPGHHHAEDRVAGASPPAAGVFALEVRFLLSPREFFFIYNFSLVYAWHAWRGVEGKDAVAGRVLGGRRSDQWELSKHPWCRWLRPFAARRRDEPGRR
jgi:hypothetical protein